MPIFTTANLKLLVSQGAIRTVRIHAIGDAFGITINGDGELMTRRKDVKLYLNLHTAAQYLFDLGIGRFDVDMSGWTPSQKSLRAKGD